MFSGDPSDLDRRGPRRAWNFSCLAPLDLRPAATPAYVLNRGVECRVDEADRGSARPGAPNSPTGPPAKGGNGMNRTHKRTCPVFLPHR